MTQSNLHKFLKLSQPTLTQDLVKDSREKGRENGNISDPIFHFLERLEKLISGNKVNDKSRLDLLSKIIRREDKYVIEDEKIPKKYSNRQEEIQSLQRNSLMAWVDYLKDENAVRPNCPLWFKWWALRNIVNLDDKFNSRSKSTVSEFLILNEAALALCYELICKVKKIDQNDIGEHDLNLEEEKIIESANFSQIYKLCLEKVKELQAKLLENQLEGKQEGVWVEYKKGDHKKLALDVQGTNWCTVGSGTAEAQLNSGNFYVYKIKDKKGNFTIPKIAILTSGGFIDERSQIRGILPGQKIEDEYAEAIINFILDLFKQGKIKNLAPLDYLQNTSFVRGKVITRKGELVDEDEYEIQNGKKIPESEILWPTPIFGEAFEVKVPEIKDKLDLDVFLKETPATKTCAGIFRYGGVNRLNFSETKPAPQKAEYKKLQKNSNDATIARKLGIQLSIVDRSGNLTGEMTKEQEELNKDKLWTVEEITTFMQQQMEMQSGKIVAKKGDILDTGNCNSNIFYVKGTDNKLRSFFCLWRPGRGEWVVESSGFGGEWPDGPRVFSRN